MADTDPTLPDIEAGAKRMDSEANAFAMELLMPMEFLVAEVHRLGGIDIEDERRVKKLAERFRVSVPVMTLRLGQLIAERKP